MIIRDYQEEDEQDWVRCRVVSFLDCSYFNDVKREKEQYEKPAICLVAEENSQIVGLIDVELDSDDLSCANGRRGAIVWNLAVLPEYRRSKVARHLWETVKERLIQEGIHYCEIWTQEDEAANRFYQSIGFEVEQSQCWLRCYLKSKEAMQFFKKEQFGPCGSIEQLVIELSLDRKKEVADYCSRMDEVRLYVGEF